MLSSFIQNIEMWITCLDPVLANSEKGRGSGWAVRVGQRLPSRFGQRGAARELNLIQACTIRHTLVANVFWSACGPLAFHSGDFEIIPTNKSLPLWAGLFRFPPQTRSSIRGSRYLAAQPTILKATRPISWYQPRTATQIPKWGSIFQPFFWIGTEYYFGSFFVLIPYATIGVTSNPCKVLLPLCT